MTPASGYPTSCGRLPVGPHSFRSEERALRLYGLGAPNMLLLLYDIINIRPTSRRHRLTTRANALFLFGNKLRGQEVCSRVSSSHPSKTRITIHIWSRSSVDLAIACYNITRGGERYKLVRVFRLFAAVFGWHSSLDCSSPSLDSIIVQHLQVTNKRRPDLAGSGADQSSTMVLVILLTGQGPVD